ncbi:hypothetical protein YTPLAS18_29030 [Nitrospira sp.]|nr:hypothetical protein YTPLAS18_29030 [Nitrospira sp.]
MAPSGREPVRAPSGLIPRPAFADAIPMSQVIFGSPGRETEDPDWTAYHQPTALAPAKSTIASPAVINFRLIMTFNSPVSAQRFHFQSCNAQ